MRHLYLIRHATPEIQPNVPAGEWNLSERGFEEARALGATARAWGIHAIYASSERKAQSTALAMSEQLEVPVHVVEGFEELRIDNWIGNSDEFGETVQQILQEPELSFRGAERSHLAAERFAGGIAIVEQGQFPAAVVSHGRVLTAWLAYSGRTDEPFALWRSLPMPGWTRIDLDDKAARPVFVG